MTGEVPKHKAQVGMIVRKLSAFLHKPDLVKKERPGLGMTNPKKCWALDPALRDPTWILTFLSEETKVELVVEICLHT